MQSRDFYEKFVNKFLGSPLAETPTADRPIALALTSQTGFFAEPKGRNAV